MRFKLFFFLILVNYFTTSSGQVMDALDLDTCRTYKDLEAALEDPDKVYKLQLQKMKGMKLHFWILMHIEYHYKLQQKKLNSLIFLQNNSLAFPLH